MKLETRSSRNLVVRRIGARSDVWQRCLLDIHGCQHGDDVPLLSGHRAEELLGHVTDVFVENFVVQGRLRFATMAGRRAYERLPCGVGVNTTFDYDDVVVVDAMGRERDFDASGARITRTPRRYCTSSAGGCSKSA
jgi:hypothetical protein